MWYLLLVLRAKRVQKKAQYVRRTMPASAETERESWFLYTRNASIIVACRKRCYSGFALSKTKQEQVFWKAVVSQFRYFLLLLLLSQLKLNFLSMFACPLYKLQLVSNLIQFRSPPISLKYLASKALRCIAVVWTAQCEKYCLPHAKRYFMHSIAWHLLVSSCSRQKQYDIHSGPSCIFWIVARFCTEEIVQVRAGALPRGRMCFTS